MNDPLLQVRLADGSDLGLVPEGRLRESLASGRIPVDAAVCSPDSDAWYSVQDWALGVDVDARVIPPPLKAPADDAHLRKQTFLIRPFEGGLLGPMPERRIALLIKCGILRRGDLVQRVGSERWREVGKVAAEYFKREGQMELASDHPDAEWTEPSTIDLTDLSPSPTPTMEARSITTHKTTPMVWALRIAALVVFPTLLSIGIASTQFQRRDDAESAYEAARERATEAVRAYAESIDQKNLQDSADFKLADELDRLERQLVRIQRDMGKHSEFAAALEQYIAQGPRIEQQVRATRALITQGDELLAEQQKLLMDLEREANALRSNIELQLKLGEITERQFLNQRVEIDDYVTRKQQEISLLEQRLAKARADAAEFSQHLQNIPMKEVQLTASREKLEALSRERSQVSVRRDLLAAGKAATVERKAAEEAMSASWLEMKNARSAVRMAALWGAFGGLLLDGLIVAGVLLTRPRST